MGAAQVFDTLMDFFNVSGVSKAWANLGNQAFDDLAMNVSRIGKGQKFVAQVADKLDDGLKKSWDGILEGAKSRSAADTARMMDDFISNKGFQDVLSAQDETIQKAVSEYLAKDRGNAVKYFGREAKGTVGVGSKIAGLVADPQYGGTRVKSGLAIAGGVAVGTRLLSGGSLTTNARGEHDIAGIPFF